MSMFSHFQVFPLLCSIVMTGSTVSLAQSSTLYGEVRTLGQGTARSLVILGEQGKPVAIGIAISRSVLTGLPAGPAPTEIALPLPGGVAVPPYTHLTVDWNPIGHEPPKIYDTPHFDFHFYMIPSGEREVISAENTVQFAMAPSAEFLPSDYRPAPGGVPQMGAHWIDVTSPEFRGEPFTATFIYGSYKSSVTFLEPMISLTALRTAKDFSMPIKQAAAVERRGYYPKSYRVVYNETEGQYRILLDELAYR